MSNEYSNSNSGMSSTTCGCNSTTESAPARIETYPTITTTTSGTAVEDLITQIITRPDDPRTRLQLKALLSSAGQSKGGVHHSRRSHCEDNLTTHPQSSPGIYAIPPQKDIPPGGPDPDPSNNFPPGHRAYAKIHAPVNHCTFGAPCQIDFETVPGFDGLLPYLRPGYTFDQTKAKHLIVAVHGANPPGLGAHPAYGMYSDMWEALSNNLKNSPQYVVIAPIFQMKNYKPVSLVCPKAWYWSGGSLGWHYGNSPRPFDWSDFIPEWESDSGYNGDFYYLGHGAGGSPAAQIDFLKSAYNYPNNLPYGPARPSSFTALYWLIRKFILEYMPHIEAVTLVGHSAGGQLVTRLALLDVTLNDFVFGVTGKRLRHVAINSGSGVYLIPQRYTHAPFRDYNNCNVNMFTDDWILPQCQDGYDDYPAGLQSDGITDGISLHDSANYIWTNHYDSLSYSIAFPGYRRVLARNFFRKDLFMWQDRDDGISNAVDVNSCSLAQQGCNVREIYTLYRASLERHPDMPADWNTSRLNLRDPNPSWAIHNFRGMLRNPDIFHSIVWDTVPTPVCGV